MKGKNDIRYEKVRHFAQFDVHTFLEECRELEKIIRSFRKDSVSEIMSYENLYSSNWTKIVNPDDLDMDTWNQSYKVEGLISDPLSRTPFCLSLEYQKDLKVFKIYGQCMEDDLLDKVRMRYDS